LKLHSNSLSMTPPISRRRFLARSAIASAVPVVFPQALSLSAERKGAADSEFKAADLHVHLDNSTLEKVLELARERGLKFGIVEHAGTKANQYPTVLSNDAELSRYLAMLEGQPVFKGIQAEWIDWMGCFSPGVLARLDYVLTDAMTFPARMASASSCGCRRWRNRWT
jgi:hypothetical protein